MSPFFGARARGRHRRCGRESPKEGVDGESAAICRGIRFVARSRLLRPIGQVQPETVREVEQAIAMILGIDRQRLA